jgi:hypothetical protein
MKGAQAAANTSRLVPRAVPLAGPGQSPGLTSFTRFPVPKTDMGSKGRQRLGLKVGNISRPSFGHVLIGGSMREAMRACSSFFTCPFLR